MERASWFLELEDIVDPYEQTAPNTILLDVS
jgi:hypothetical protein